MFSLLWITLNSDVHTDNLCCQDFEGKNNTLNKKIGCFPEKRLDCSLCDFQYALLPCVRFSTSKWENIYLRVEGKEVLAKQMLVNCQLKQSCDIGDKIGF